MRLHREDGEKSDAPSEDLGGRGGMSGLSRGNVSSRSFRSLTNAEYRLSVRIIVPCERVEP